MRKTYEDAGTLLNRIVRHIPSRERKTAKWEVFEQRLSRHFPKLLSLLLDLYGNTFDFLYFLEDLLYMMWKNYRERPKDILALDAARERDTHWFAHQRLVGAIIYVDLFADTIDGLMKRLPYLEELGVTYVHLMPLFDVPEGESDGGYAVKSYREVQPNLGTMDDLRKLAKVFRKKGISLVLDFILNHTSDQHIWAQQAAAGDPYYQQFYFMFPDRQEPDEYNIYLRDIFPEAKTGSFTYHEETGKWVWTTFNSFQWDLNYKNHEVFKAMAEEMLFLANVGTEVLRFDAIAFVWKEKGTVCESLPKAHTVIKAFKAVASIVAPAMEFKSEAIVHPDEVIQYVGTDECALSYNPLIMATAWEALATRDPKLFRESVARRYYIPPGCSWVNYVRCHDDIGWTFDDSDAQRLGINGYYHRKFLNDFYTGRFPGSFARGLPFQENLKTGDCRISGMCASLAGLEKGIVTGNEQEISYAVGKIVLLYGLMFSLGGIPLIYMGDEIGMLNDYAYAADMAKARDSRWVNRVTMDWFKAEKRHEPDSIEERIFSQLQKMIAVRKREPAFSMGSAHVADYGHQHLLWYIREGKGYGVVVLANFSDKPSVISMNDLLLINRGDSFEDLLTHRFYQGTFEISPWGIMWLKEQKGADEYYG